MERSSMKARRPSRTAEHNALFRAIECSRPLQVRIVNDPMARTFLGFPFRLAALFSHSSVCRAPLCRYIDHRWPGSRTSLIARTRLIDDYLTCALASGVRQVVLLGAGFDSRAYRTEDACRARFFEVDHPNTSAIKQALVLRSLGTLPEHVKFVSVDFQRESVRNALGEAGFDGLDRSLFIWEGVSNYLTEESVRSTLAFISSLIQGTQLIFTYVDEAVIRNPSASIGGREVQRTIAKLEEPWTFGIRPAHAVEFFRESGLCLDNDLSAPEYRRLYYGDRPRIQGYEFYHVVTAYVPPDEKQLHADPTAEVHDA
jgi:methyltransferase (TIGR00027 family)